MSDRFDRSSVDVLGLDDLAEPIPPISASASAATAMERFLANPHLVAMPVLDGDRPVGLVNRQTVLETFASRYGWDRNAGRPVVELIDLNPLIVEASTPVALLGRTLTSERPEALLHGFILVRDGRYLGVGMPLKVMRRFMRDLETRQRQADQANRAKSYFLANMSHELRTPLNAILGFSEIVKLRALGDGPDAEARYAEYISDIHSSGAYLLELISDLLEISRVEAGVRALMIGAHDVRVSLDRAARLLEPMAENHGVRLSCAGPRGVSARVDPRALQQILMNFGTNAIKFSPRGGAVELRCDVSESGDWVDFVVLDEGPGFRKTQSPTSAMIASAKGAGLGLNLCRALAREMGGCIETGDRPTVGARALVRVPASAEQAVAAEG